MVAVTVARGDWWNGRDVSAVPEGRAQASKAALGAHVGAGHVD